MKKIVLSMLTISCAFMLFISNVSAVSKILDAMPSYNLINYIYFSNIFNVTDKKKDTNILFNKNMIKNDTGKIINFFKTTVQYWGYKYNNYLSLSEVTILHD